MESQSYSLENAFPEDDQVAALTYLRSTLETLPNSGTNNLRWEAYDVLIKAERPKLLCLFTQFVKFSCLTSQTDSILQILFPVSHFRGRLKDLCQNTITAQYDLSKALFSRYMLTPQIAESRTKEEIRDRVKDYSRWKFYSQQCASPGVKAPSLFKSRPWLITG